MQSRQHEQFAPPRHETNTVWYNPLDVVQRVRVFYGDGMKNESRATEFVFAPKVETLVPSRFDAAIQVVHCAEESCRRKAPGYCVDLSHEGNVVGGLAPQLIRKGQVAKLLPVLDPAQAELEQTRAELAASDIARKSAENAQVIAEARRQELETELAKRDAEDKSKPEGGTKKK